jgi:hypothetical protein
MGDQLAYQKKIKDFKERLAKLFQDEEEEKKEEKEKVEVVEDKKEE